MALEHADIADRNRVLHAAHGFTVTPRDSIRDTDIRRQLEYELLAHLLGVRSAIAAAGQDVRAQREILGAHASQAVALMRAALRLAGQTPAADGEAVCAAIGSLAGFDAAPFVAALRQRHGQDVPKPTVAATLEGFHAGLGKLVAFVDSR
jgi:hypothetical protein